MGYGGRGEKLAKPTLLDAREPTHRRVIGRLAGIDQCHDLEEVEQGLVILWVVGRFEH
jgi:hypothetical protein